MTAATVLAPDQQRPRQRAVAVDGKTLRGARGAGADGRLVHLLACMDHTSRAVLMSLSTIVVALNAQLLRRVDLRPTQAGH